MPRRREQRELPRDEKYMGCLGFKQLRIGALLVKFIAAAFHSTLLTIDMFELISILMTTKAFDRND
jgi:hypothetical protein